jgi:hypothetical protein
MVPVKYIIQGWWNWLLDLVSDIKYKKEFDARLEICRQCENNKHGICAICHCVLVAKTKSEDSECPVGKWKAIQH